MSRSPSFDMQRTRRTLRLRRRPVPMHGEARCERLAHDDMGSNCRTTPKSRDYAAEPPSHWTSHSHGNPALRASNVAGDEAAPLAPLVRRGLPGVRSHDSDAKPCAVACLDDCETVFHLPNVAHPAALVTLFLTLGAHILAPPGRLAGLGAGGLKHPQHPSASRRAHLQVPDSPVWVHSAYVSAN